MDKDRNAEESVKATFIVGLHVGLSEVLRMATIAHDCVFFPGWIFAARYKRLLVLALTFCSVLTLKSTTKTNRLQS